MVKSARQPEGRSRERWGPGYAGSGTPWCEIVFTYVKLAFSRKEGFQPPPSQPPATPLPSRGVQCSEDSDLSLRLAVSADEACWVLMTLWGRPFVSSLLSLRLPPSGKPAPCGARVRCVGSRLCWFGLRQGPLCVP